MIIAYMSKYIVVKKTIKGKWIRYKIGLFFFFTTVGTGVRRKTKDILMTEYCWLYLVVIITGDS